MSSFSTGSASRNSQSKKVESKKPFFDCVRKPDLGLSRKRPFSTGVFFDWIPLILFLVVSRVDFIVFVLFREVVCVREYCCVAVEIGWQLCFARSSLATRASRATNLRPSALVALGLAESRQSYGRGVALSREPAKLQQA